MVVGEVLDPELVAEEVLGPELVAEEVLDPELAVGAVLGQLVEVVFQDFLILEAEAPMVEAAEE